MTTETTPRRFGSVQDLIDHLRDLGRTESVEISGMTELDHGLQCAALLRLAAPDDVELQIAGLVHDLAHPWDSAGQPRHAGMGAAAIVDVLGDRVADLVLGHVPAKRYLVTTQPEYRDLLSPDSIMTLEAQGGVMDPDELTEFTAHPDWEAMVLLRVADDGAKVPGTEVPGLDTWLGQLIDLAR